MASEDTKVNTSRFGMLTIERSRVLLFPKGILGFEEHHEYVILTDPEYSPFGHLQSMTDPALAFTIIEPRIIFPHYKVRVDRSEIAELEVTDLSWLETRVIITVPNDIGQMSANLQGPILINPRRNLGKQVVLMRSPYTTRHYLMDELNKRATATRAGLREPVPV